MHTTRTYCNKFQIGRRHRRRKPFTSFVTLEVYSLSLPLDRSDYSLERSDYLVERSGQRMERSGLERSGHGTK